MKSTQASPRPVRFASFLLASHLLGGVLLAGLCAGCGGGGGESDAQGAPATSGPASSALRRDKDPVAKNVRKLIDQGQADLARPLLKEIGPALGLERPLLEARLTFLEGNDAEWLAHVEEARAMDPKDPRPYSTAAEIYAAMGRVEAARAEIRRGAEVAGGVTPEIQRARGVLAIVTPGGAKAGLNLLEAAYRADSELPFMGRALGQAYYLNAQAARGDHAKEVALERIENSLRFDPDEPDARRFFAELLLADNDRMLEGLDIFEDLYAEGLPIKPELGRHHWRAGLMAMTQGVEGAARKHYLRARELDCPDVDEGSARDFMRDQAIEASARAVSAAELGDEEALRDAVAEVAGLRGKREEDIARRELSTRMIARANTALGERDLGRAASLISSSVFVDRGAPGVAEVQCAFYQAKAIEAMGKGEADEALLFASEATVVRPDSTLSWQMLGELQHAKGDFAGAARSLLKAANNSRADGAPLEIEAAQMLAECQHLSQDTEGAVLTIEQALREAQPGDDAVRMELERYLKLLKR